jgi:hypothetical protein
MCGSDNTCICDAGYKLGPNGCEQECSGCAEGATCIGPGECGCLPACARGTCYSGRCECWAGGRQGHFGGGGNMEQLAGGGCRGVVSKRSWLPSGCETRW